MNKADTSLTRKQELENEISRLKKLNAALQIHFTRLELRERLKEITHSGLVSQNGHEVREQSNGHSVPKPRNADGKLPCIPEKSPSGGIPIGQKAREILNRLYTSKPSNATIELPRIVKESHSSGVAQSGHEAGKNEYVLRKPRNAAGKVPCIPEKSPSGGVWISQKAREILNRLYTSKPRNATTELHCIEKESDSSGVAQSGHEAVKNGYALPKTRSAAGKLPCILEDSPSGGVRIGQKVREVSNHLYTPQPRKTVCKSPGIANSSVSSGVCGSRHETRKPSNGDGTKPRNATRKLPSSAEGSTKSHHSNTRIVTEFVPDSCVDKQPIKGVPDSQVPVFAPNQENAMNCEWELETLVIEETACRYTDAFPDERLSWGNTFNLKPGPRPNYNLRLPPLRSESTDSDELKENELN
jgi:hypothetical protein